jgi:hypothetical protein
MGTLVLKNPQNMLCTFAITLIDNVINVYQAVVSSRNSPRMVKNLHWLRRLRERLDVRMAQTPEEQNGNTGDSTHGDGDDQEELLGWRTRLISSAGRGLQVSSTIRTNTVPNSHPNHASSAVNYETMSHPSSLGAAAEGNVWDSEVSTIIPLCVATPLVQAY